MLLCSIHYKDFPASFFKKDLQQWGPFRTPKEGTKTTLLHIVLMSTGLCLHPSVMSEQ